MVSSCGRFIIKNKSKGPHQVFYEQALATILRDAKTFSQDSRLDPRRRQWSGASRRSWNKTTPYQSRLLHFGFEPRPWYFGPSTSLHPKYSQHKLVRTFNRNDSPPKALPKRTARSSKCTSNHPPCLWIHSTWQQKTTMWKERGFGESWFLRLSSVYAWSRKSCTTHWAEYTEDAFNVEQYT